MLDKSFWLQTLFHEKGLQALSDSNLQAPGCDSRLHVTVCLAANPFEESFDEGKKKSERRGIVRLRGTRQKLISSVIV